MVDLPEQEVFGCVSCVDDDECDKTVPLLLDDNIVGFFCCLEVILLLRLLLRLLRRVVLDVAVDRFDNRVSIV